VELKHTSHAVYKIAYHFTFIPKYRKRRLVGRVKEQLSGMIKFCAQVNDFTIEQLAIDPDHVHLVLEAKPRYSPAKIMNLVKGGTSKKLREMFPDMEESIWCDSFWADGYFVGSLGERNMREVKEYVKKHQRP
jgi:putative transposase